MKFSGRLQIEADSRDWIKIDLSLDHGRLELTSGSEVLGTWAMSRVRADRIDGDRFELQLGDDRALFTADDALAFSYEAMPHLAKKHGLTGPNGLRERIKNGLRNGDRHPDHQNEPVPARTSHEKTGTNAWNGVVDPIPLAPAINRSGPIGVRGLRELLQRPGYEPGVPEAHSVDFLPDIGDPKFGTPNGGMPDMGAPYGGMPEGWDSIESMVSYAPPMESEETPETSTPSLFDAIAAEEATPDPIPELEAWIPTPRHVGEPVPRSSNGHARLNGTRLDLEPAFTKLNSAPNPRSDSQAGSHADPQPESRIMTALEGVLVQVRQGSMNPAQVSAVTDLVQAVTDLMTVHKSNRT